MKPSLIRPVRNQLRFVGTSLKVSTYQVSNCFLVNYMQNFILLLEYKPFEGRIQI